jgi:hypothetical protein
MGLPYRHAFIVTPVDPFSNPPDAQSDWLVAPRVARDWLAATRNWARAGELASKPERQGRRVVMVFVLIDDGHDMVVRTIVNGVTSRGKTNPLDQPCRCHPTAASRAPGLQYRG